MDDKTKEQRYEDLVNAVAGGELTMVKFLWNLIDGIDSLIKKTPQAQYKKAVDEAEKMVKELKPLYEQIQKKPPKDGKTPSRAELEEIIRPMIPRPIPGEPGDSPSEEYLLELIESVMPDPIPGPRGKRGPRGKTGDGFAGGVPKHEWNGTFIRFEQPNGDWGEWVNLQGVPGPESMGGYNPGAAMQIPVKAGTNVTITRDASGAQVISSTATGGGGSGNGNATTIEYETPTGTVNDSNVTFTVTRAPLYIVVNGVQYFENQGYTLSSLTVTLDAAVGTGGYIRSAYVSQGFETPSGTVDDSNTTFTVANAPLFVVVNGQKLFAGAGYSYAAGTITLDAAVGTGGFIRSVYEDGANNETPTGTVNDSNTTFAVDNEPRYLVINGLLYFAGEGYTYTSGTIDLDSPVGDNGFIRSVY